MKLYINSQLVLPALGSVTLRKRRSEAAATLTATLYTAAADTYFQTLFLALGQVAELWDDEGNLAFRGSIHELRRSPQQVVLTAYDQGILLSRNELRGLFCGSPTSICTQAAQVLEIPLGTLELPTGWICIPARSGCSAFSILRQAAGEGREIAIRDGVLSITKSAYTVYPLEPSQVLTVSSCVSLQQMVNRCEIVDREGALLATAETASEIASFGQMQTVLQTDGSAPAAQAAAALSPRIFSGEISTQGNIAFLCGCAVELHCPSWGLDGIYAVVAAEHRWEHGIYTTSMELEWIRT